MSEVFSIDAVCSALGVEITPEERAVLDEKTPKNLEDGMVAIPGIPVNVHLLMDTFPELFEKRGMGWDDQIQPSISIDLRWFVFDIQNAKQVAFDQINTALSPGYRLPYAREGIYCLVVFWLMNKKLLWPNRPAWCQEECSDDRDFQIVLKFDEIEYIQIRASQKDGIEFFVFPIQE